MKIVPVWDLPLRLFHWLLVLSVMGAYVTGSLGGSWTDWHERLGGFILGLLVFRIIWGFIGSTPARFSHFLPTISRLIAYFKGEWKGVGHNPAGAFAVFAILALLIFQVVTGIFANDDIAFEGPLYHLIDKDLSDKLTGLHSRSFNLLLVFLGLHVGAILFYQFFKKHNLVLPMLTGKKQLPKTLADSHAIQIAGKFRFVVTSLIAISVVWGIWNNNEFVDYLVVLASSTATVFL